MTNSTIANNVVDDGDGGAIANAGTLMVSNSMITGNEAGGSGGAILAYGNVTVIDSTFSTNSASVGGGGIASYDTLTVTNSTFSHNSASYGGGIFNDAGALTVINSTFTNNNGGGIVHEGEDRDLVIVGSLDVTGSIMADNPGGDCQVWSGPVSIRYSLMKDTGPSACDLTDGVNGNLIGVDPLLGPLADNGGPTETHALQAGSPAIDAIPSGAAVAAADGQAVNLVCNGLVPDRDQRGVPRPQGNGCDIGAFEYTEDTVPVTLGWFLAARSGDGAAVDFRWQTATESGTAGFNLLAAGADGARTRLNPALIQSPAIDSVEPLDYGYQAATDSTSFFLEELSIDGKSANSVPLHWASSSAATACPAMLS